MKKTDKPKQQESVVPEEPVAPVASSRCPLCDATRAELSKYLTERVKIQSAHDELDKDARRLRIENERLRNENGLQDRDLRKFGQFWEEVAELLGMEKPVAPPAPDPSLQYMHHMREQPAPKVTKSDVLVHVRLLAGREKLLQATIKQLRNQVREIEETHAAQIDDLGKRYADKV